MKYYVKNSRFHRSHEAYENDRTIVIQFDDAGDSDAERQTDSLLTLRPMVEAPPMDVYFDNDLTMSVCFMKRGNANTGQLVVKRFSLNFEGDFEMESTDEVIYGPLTQLMSITYCGNQYAEGFEKRAFAKFVRDNCEPFDMKIGQANPSTSTTIKSEMSPELLEESPEPSNNSQSFEVNNQSSYEQHELVRSAEVLSHIPRTKKYISLIQCRHDFSIRPLDYRHVQNLLNVMKEKTWDFKAVCFSVVVNAHDSTVYDVIDGNHRLAAYLEYNKICLRKDAVTTVACMVYGDSTPHERFVIAASAFTGRDTLPFASYRMAARIRQYTDTLLIPATRKDQRSYADMLTRIFGTKVSETAIKLSSIDTDVWNKLLDMYPLSETNALDFLGVKTWDEFIRAQARNPHVALSIMKDANNKNELKVNLRSVMPKLLDRLATKDNMHFTSNTEAIEYLCGEGVTLTEDQFHGVLNAVRFSSMKTTVRWTTVKQKIADHLNGLKTNSPKFTYLSDKKVNERLENVSFVVAQNPTPATFEILETLLNKKAVILVIGSKEPTIGGVAPTVSIRFYMGCPVVDRVTRIPESTIPASIFHPSIPDNNKKVASLISIMCAKELRLATVMDIKYISEFQLVPYEKKNIAIFGTTVQVANHIVSKNIEDYDEVMFAFNDELQSIVSRQYMPSEVHKTTQNDNCGVSQGPGKLNTRSSWVPAATANRPGAIKPSESRRIRTKLTSLLALPLKRHRVGHQSIQESNKTLPEATNLPVLVPAAAVPEDLPSPVKRSRGRPPKRRADPATAPVSATVQIKDIKPLSLTEF